MTIPATHKDAIVEYLTEHGEQSHLAIDDGIRRDSRHAYLSVHVTPYLLKTLCKEGRVERVKRAVGDTALYRAAAAKAEGSE